MPLFSDQTKLATIGLVTTGVTKFVFQRDWKTAALYGLAAVAFVALMRARNSTDNPAV